MFASGTARPVGFASTEPPTSPETVGRAPSNFDPPVPLVSLEELVGLNGKATPAHAAEPASTPEQAPAAAGTRRVVLRLVGGEELELGSYDGHDEAIARAQETIALVTEAEDAGEWPELGGRLLRPGAIVSVDLLVGDE
jgi:hypothetical protein